MAGAYLVSLSPDLVGRNLQNGVDAVVVYATDATDAKAMAKAAMSMDNNVAWDSATVTAIAAGANLIGWRFVIKEFTEAGVLARNVDFTAVGAAQDTIDEIGALLATALGGGAAYTSNTLTLSASGDGDHALEVNVYPPLAQGQNATIPSMVVAKTHNGSAGSALSVQFIADSPVIPVLYARCTLRN